MSGDGAQTRAARPEEADDLLRVLCAAFGLSFDAARPLFYADPFFDLSHKRLLRTPSDGPVSCLTVLPARIQIGGAWVALGGIAGVATLPGCQRRGHAGRLLSATVPALALEAGLGYPVAGLFAHDEGYYRRFGWETVSGAVGRRGLVAALPDSAGADHVRRLDGAAKAAVRPLHARLTAGRTGACARDHRRWRVIEMAPGYVWVLYEEGGREPTGYAIYERAEAAGVAALRLLEMHAATPGARRGLVGHLARQRGWATCWEWTCPPKEADALCPQALATPGPPPPGLMLRLTDTAAALAAVHAANLAPVLARTGGSLTVRAADALRPENARPVRLTAAGVGPGADADPDWIAADIRALAQALFGHRTPSEAQARGALRASSSAALALADALFPARAPFVAPLDQF